MLAIYFTDYTLGFFFFFNFDHTRYSFALYSYLLVGNVICGSKIHIASSKVSKS